MSHFSLRTASSTKGATIAVSERLQRRSRHKDAHKRFDCVPRSIATFTSKPEKPNAGGVPDYNDVPPMWTPPSDPASPRSPPEFVPPGDPGTTVRPPPEYTPPEQNPGEETRRGDPPLRPIRPDEEPQVPEPESPNADPIRTPERRREITEPPSREEGEPAPQRER